ncbi:BON domain-containing protein [Legionella brunensis]|uniref:Osmotically inducible protein Y n=1 Tax=Legionella brunensis TaxID=29422 RepID=A0A0W0SP38_9GAMM|nr:BON domain-containing protein [Legionella brunensis]KTC85128.1 osmotically inducible protein Y [Legionella brunensis]
MDKSITFKIAIVVSCISLTLVAFAKENQTSKTTANQTYNYKMIAIKNAVQSALRDYMSKVTMKVSNGVVFLSGRLDSEANYEKIITLAESTQGVKDVNVDQLTVKGSQQSLKDISITAKVKGALIREDIMDKNISSWTIHVDTQKGQVFLTGQVGSIKQKDSIMKVVKSVNGVHEVNDKITMKPTSKNSKA